MDYSSIIISLLIAAYGVMEYRRREKIHCRELASLRGGEIPLYQAPMPPFWTLLTTGSVCFILAGAAGWLLYRSWISGRNYAGPLRTIGIVFSVILAILLPMFIRDIRVYAASRQGRKGRGR